MKEWEKIKVSVSKHNSFDNYFSRQTEVNELKDYFFKNAFVYPIKVISGKSGSGVTHLLHAISNNYLEKNVLFTNAQWMVHLIKQIKTDIELNKFQDYILTYDIILIDNLQFLYKKSSRYSRFIIGLIRKCDRINKALVLGCSEPGKDITKIKKYTQAFTLQKIELKPLNSESVFQMLKNLCEFEPSIPDKLLFAISGYNGSIQQYVNCLISIRFKSKVENINLHSLSIEEIEDQFRIEKYFPEQQFRKCFTQPNLNFLKENVAKVSLIIPKDLIKCGMA